MKNISLSELWAKEYAGNYSFDFIAGITTMVVALPLALGFAIASGVEPKHGIATAIVAGIVAAVFGGSKVQVSGPTGGMAAILIGVTLEYGYEKVLWIGLLAGVFQLIAGFLRLGRFAKILPFPLVEGFTIGIALVVFGGQVDNAFGLTFHHESKEFLSRLLESVSVIFAGQFQNTCVGVALATGIMYFALSRISPRFPSALTSIASSAFFSVWMGYEIPIVGQLPQTISMSFLPAIDFDTFTALIRPAAVVAALGAIESVMAAVVADGILSDGSKHDSDRELKGQGLANIAVSFFGGIPCTGAIARTVVNIKSGARTRLAAIIHSASLLIVVFFLGSVVSHIPLAALAGLLMAMSLKMVNWHEVRWLFRGPRSDVAVLIVTAGATVFTDLVVGVEIGLAMASILFIQKATVTSSKIKEIAMDHPLIQNKDVAVVALPGPLFWGASHAILDSLEYVQARRAVILDFSRVPNIDASGVAMLKDLKERLGTRNTGLHVTNVNGDCAATMKKMGIVVLGESLESLLCALKSNS